MYIKQSPENKRLRENVFTTLALAALLHGTNEAVKSTAKRLLRDAPGSLRKSVLHPLSSSDHALEIIAEEVIWPKQEKTIGWVYRDGYEYDIVLIWYHFPYYSTEEIVSAVVSDFIKRGIVDGRIYLNFQGPFNRFQHTDSVDMKLAVSRVMQNYNHEHDHVCEVA